MNQLERDLYYLRIAKTVSLRSKCLSRKIGAVLVNNDSIISCGFNGPPRGVKHCNERPQVFYNELDKPNEVVVDERICYNECPRKHFGYKSGQGLHLCQAGHAERNALIQAARNGISTLNTTMYCWCPYPCKDCIIECINAGVKEIVCLEGEWYDAYSRVLIEESGILIRTISDVDLLGD